MDLTSGYPFWPVKDGLIRAYPRLDEHVQCDVAVLGGGITGALVAHGLVEAGFDTVVVDRRDIGWGSTASSTALLQYELDVLLVDLAKRLGFDHASRSYLACLEAIRKLERLARGLREDVGFETKKEPLSRAAIARSRPVSARVRRTSKDRNPAGSAGRRRSKTRIWFRPPRRTPVA